MNKITQLIYDLVKDLPEGANQITGNFKLFSKEKSFFELDIESIKLGNLNIVEKIVAQKDKLDKPVRQQNWHNFLKELNNSYVRLNHFGVSYTCDDLEGEISFYKDLASTINLNLYEEPSGDFAARWLFIGDTTEWRDPMFEIVLTKNLNNPENIWRPHFQIDIDTNLDEASLDKLLIKNFGPGFTKWKITIPNYGTVLLMGLLGSINGTKIYLAAGTSLRNTQYLREKVLKKV